MPRASKAASPFLKALLTSFLFVLFPARTVIVPAGSMRKFTIPLPFSSPVCFIRRGLRPALLPMLQRLAVVMALPPVTRGLDGYNAGFGGFVALIVKEPSGGKERDLNPWRSLSLYGFHRRNRPLCHPSRLLLLRLTSLTGLFRAFRAASCSAHRIRYGLHAAQTGFLLTGHSGYFPVRCLACSPSPFVVKS